MQCTGNMLTRPDSCATLLSVSSWVCHFAAACAAGAVGAADVAAAVDGHPRLHGAQGRLEWNGSAHRCLQRMQAAPRAVPFAAAALP